MEITVFTGTFNTFWKTTVKSVFKHTILSWKKRFFKYVVKFLFHTKTLLRNKPTKNVSITRKIAVPKVQLNFISKEKRTNIQFHMKINNFRTKLQSQLFVKQTYGSFRLNWPVGGHYWPHVCTYMYLYCPVNTLF